VHDLQNSGLYKFSFFFAGMEQCAMVLQSKFMLVGVCLCSSDCTAGYAAPSAGRQCDNLTHIRPSICSSDNCVRGTLDVLL
jgi:hypothetical protein